MSDMNGDSMHDSLGLDSITRTIQRVREREWRKGFHEKSDYSIIRLSDMKDSHIRNTINIFKGKGYNVQSLTNELNTRRDLLNNK